MYRSKIGLVSLQSVRAQLGALFGFVGNVPDDCRPKNKKEILKEMCSGDRFHKIVEDFLEKINKQFVVKNMNKSMQAALCYKFQEECHNKYLNGRFYYQDGIVLEKRKKEKKNEEKEKKNKNKDKELYKPRNQGRFRDLCLQYWGIEEKNTLKPNKCQHLMDKFGIDTKETDIWQKMSKEPENSPYNPLLFPQLNSPL
jgi:hypothetical protein